MKSLMESVHKRPIFIGAFLTFAFLTTAEAQSPSPSAKDEAPILLGFKTPSNNIHCDMDQSELTTDSPKTPSADVYLRCDILEYDNAPPPKPRNCDGDWGQAFVVAGSGTTASRICYTDTTVNEQHQVLPYGSVWQRNGFTCRSESSGLMLQFAWSRIHPIAQVTKALLEPCAPRAGQRPADRHARRDGGRHRGVMSAIGKSEQDLFGVSLSGCGPQATCVEAATAPLAAPIVRAGRLNAGLQQQGRMIPGGINSAARAGRFFCGFRNGL